MKRILTVLFLSILFCGVNAQNREIYFEQTTLKEALSKAEKEKKITFVDCYTEYCGPCKIMAAGVFKTDSVADFFNQTFVNVKLDMLGEDGKQYIKKYAVGAYPSFLLLTPDGELLYKFIGGCDAEKFMAQIRQGLDPKNKHALLEKQYASGKHSDALIREYIELKLSLLEKNEAMEITTNYLNSLSHAQRVEAENWFIYTNRILAAPGSENMQYFITHSNDFIPTIGKEKVYARLQESILGIAETVLRGWYFKEHKNDAASFAYLKESLQKTTIPCKQDYLVMSDMIIAACNNDSATVCKLVMDNIEGFSEKNQSILFSLSSYLPYRSENTKIIARKLLRQGRRNNVTNYLKSVLPSDEAYFGEKYDVHNLKDKIGNTVIVPFFHPTKDLFWYMLEDGDKKKRYYAYDPKVGKRELYNTQTVDSLARALNPNKEPSVSYNPEFDGDYLLPKLTCGGKIYIYDSIERKLIPSEPKAYKSIPPYGTSPDGKYKLVCEDYNLWLEDITSKSRKQLTFDGAADFSFSVADIEWLSDSTYYITRIDKRAIRKLAVISSNAHYMPLTANQYNYEFPGDEKVSQYELFVGNVQSQVIHNVELAKWEGQLIEPIRVKDVHDKAYFWRKKRTRDEAELCTVDPITAKVKVILHEVSKPYLNEELFGCKIVNKGKDIFLWSDRTGWGHYYHYSGDGTLLNKVTEGAWTAGRVLRIDEEKKVLYLQGYGKEKGRNPNYIFVYKVGYKGDKLTLLTPENATHSTLFISPNNNIIVDNHSRIDTIPQVSVRTTDGKLLSVIEDVDVSKLTAFGWKYPEMFTVKAADGVTDLYGIMWKPYDFDSSKKYPIVSQVYPGPQTETVCSEFTVFDRYNNTALAQRGIIVICVGHRGSSPYRNKAYATYGYGNLRDYALADDKYALEQLGSKYSYIDLNRVGIYGHSGGGMMAVAALCTYPEFYKVAVASSGNHDNRIYNRTWGETYQGIGEDNQFNVATNQELVKYMKGRLLLVTGESDQNVHPAHTLRLANELILQEKDFDLLILPGQGHSYEGAYKTYFEKKKRDYFTKYLLEE